MGTLEGDSPGRQGSGRKLLALLDALARGGAPQRLGDLADVTGMTKPTAHRQLAVLTAEGWAIAGDGGFYRLGPRATAMAAQIRSGDDPIERIVVELAQEVNQTVHAGMLADGRVLYTHKANAPANFHMRSRVGLVMPAHATGLGKAMLAQLPDQRVREILDRTGMPAITPATVTDIDALLDECAQIRRVGYAVDREENEANVRCIATGLRPVSGGVAAVSITSITFVTDEDALLALAPTLRDAARRIEAVW